MTGIMMSRRIRSGESAAILSKASPPFAAVAVS